MGSPFMWEGERNTVSASITHSFLRERGKTNIMKNYWNPYKGEQLEPGVAATPKERLAQVKSQVLVKEG